MSEGASEERRRIIRRFGAKLILFKSAGQYQAGIRKSLAMAARDKRYFLPRQFENPLNVEDHGTAPAGKFFSKWAVGLCRHKISPFVSTKTVCGIGPAHSGSSALTRAFVSGSLKMFVVRPSPS
jgi:cysteine synthase